MAASSGNDCDLFQFICLFALYQLNIEYSEQRQEPKAQVSKTSTAAHGNNTEPYVKMTISIKQTRSAFMAHERTLTDSGIFLNENENENENYYRINKSQL